MTASSDDEAVTELALAAARGNERALEAFIKATQKDVWRFVTYLSDAGSADDLTQGTFLRAIGAIERFSGRSTARTWLLSIARFKALSSFRRRTHQPPGLTCRPGLWRFSSNAMNGERRPHIGTRLHASPTRSFSKSITSSRGR